MGRLPGSWDPPAWGGPWVGLLLSASVLSSSLQPAPAQTIRITPPSPVVGGDVSLAPENPPQDFTSCNWYRAATTEEPKRILKYFPTTPPVQNPGPAHTGRETAGLNCTLNIAGLTLNDIGSYTLQMESPTNSVLTSVNLRVSEMLPQPMVTPNQTQVLENGTFNLTCNSSPGTDTLLWLRDGSDLATDQRLKLSPNNRTLTVLNVSQGDSGAYQCEVRNPVSTNRSEPSTVTVASSPTAAPGTSLSAGAIAGIVIGSLAGLALVGGLVYFLCSDRRSKTPQGSDSTPPVYENLPPAAQVGPAAQPGSPPDTSPTYQTLQPGQRDMYDQLRR